MTKPLVRLLMPPPSSHPSRMISSEPLSPKSITLPLLSNSQDSESNTADDQNIPERRPSNLRMLLCTPTHTVHRYWRKFDDGFMRPVFGGRGFVQTVTTSAPATTTLE